MTEDEGVGSHNEGAIQLCQEDDQLSAKPIDRLDRELVAVTRVIKNRQKAPPSRIRRSGDGYTVDTGGQTSIGDRALLLDTFGTADEGFFRRLVHQLVNSCLDRGEINESAADFLLAAVRGVEPRDETEAMLAAQMAAVHAATMRAAKRLNEAATVPAQDSAGVLLTRLTRTFAAQVEALKRYRTGGEQRVVVQHVTVSGGQAIVGAMSTGGGGRHRKSEETP